MPMNLFPYTNFHEMNLDWIIAQIKTINQTETETAAYAQEAKLYRDAAQVQASNALASANTANQAMNNALDSATSALQSAGNAAASASQAQQYAENIGDPVSGIVTNWLQSHITQETGYVIDDTLTVAGAAADAKAVGDEINSLQDATIYPENTLFVERIAEDYHYASIADVLPDVRKYESLVYATGRLVSSTGSDSFCFVAPFDNFVFNVYSNTVLLVTAIPTGTVNEPVSGTALTYTEVNYRYRYTIPHKGDIVLFNHQKNFPVLIGSTITNQISIPTLSLNDIQDGLKRYGTGFTGVSDVIPFEVTKAPGMLVNTTSGGISASASYDTYYFRVPVENLTVNCTNGFRAVITIANPSTITSNGYLRSVVYSNESSRVETFTAGYGDYVVISISNAQYSNIALKTNAVQAFTLPTLKLNYGQKGQFYRIAKTGNNTYVYICYASGEKIVQWELHNVPSAPSNSNTWQLGHVMGFTFDGTALSDGVELVAGGEFELAWKEYGAADYCGGNNHGDENTIDFLLMIDGKTISPENADNDFHAFNRIDAIEHAYVNRCDIPNDNVLKHQKIWIFENGTVQVKQTLEFLQSVECDFLCCMFAANRSSFNYGVRQALTGTEDLTTSTSAKISTSGNEMMYLMYGTNASAKITAQTCEHNPAASLWINRATDINKLYYNFYGQMPRTAVTSGTIVWWRQEYDVAYN